VHDNQSIYPHLPSKPMDGEAAEFMLNPVVGTVWQTCWEYVLTHHLSESEGSAFWHGANLAMKACQATHPTTTTEPEGSKR
jgi:hypothetical protein